MHEIHFTWRGKCDYAMESCWVLLLDSTSSLHILHSFTVGATAEKLDYCPQSGFHTPLILVHTTYLLHGWFSLLYSINSTRVTFRTVQDPFEKYISRYILLLVFNVLSSPLKQYIVIQNQFNTFFQSFFNQSQEQMMLEKFPLERNF